MPLLTATVARIAAGTVIVTTWLIRMFWACVGPCGLRKDRQEHPKGSAANDANLSSSPDVVSATKTGTGSQSASVEPNRQHDPAVPSNLQPQATPLIRLHMEDDWAAVTPCDTNAKLTMDPSIRSLAFEAAWLAGTQEHPSFVGTCGCTYWMPLQLLRQSKAEGCGWCRLVCDTIEDKLKQPVKLRNDTSRNISDLDPLQIIVMFGFNCGEDSNVLALLVEIRSVNASRAFEICTKDDDNAGRFLRNRDVPRQLDSPEVYSIAHQRLAECLRHEGCPRPERSVLPSRVIDCADPTCPRLFINEGMEKELYVALSYVWGEDQPHKTTSYNLEAYTKSLTLSSMPQTIQDAIRVTHKLGIRFLWVDAYCIIQDSKEDKAHEIAKMRTIFMDAYFTIVASSAWRVSDGILHLRDPQSLATLPFLCPDRTIGTMTLSLPQLNLLNAPAAPDTRAWCLEERLLSQRLLLYSFHTLEYECQTSHTNVDGSRQYLSNPAIRRLPDHVFTQLKQVQSPDPTAIRNSDRLRTQYGVWRSILEEYTARSLTKSRDRLIALAGVAEHFNWQESRYLAGLWSIELPWGLLWRVVTKCQERPKKYRAPSWSWAAVDGKIEGYNPLAYERLIDLASSDVLGSPPICEVETYDVTPANPSYPFGAINGGYLELKTVIVNVTCSGDSDLLTCQGDSLVHFGTVHLDALEDHLTEIVVAIICKHKRGYLAGIALLPITVDDTAYHTDTQIHYRRVGFCKVNRDVYEAIDPRDMVVITVA